MPGFDFHYTSASFLHVKLHNATDREHFLKIREYYYQLVNERQNQ